MRRAAPHQTTAPTMTPLEERIVTLGYVTDPKRTTQRTAWLERHDPENRNAHLYSKLFVNEARELYFVNFDGKGGVSLICWLVGKSKRCVCITENAYNKALGNPTLGGHQFYQRCNGAWKVKDLCLDVQSSGRRP